MSNLLVKNALLRNQSKNDIYIEAAYIGDHDIDEAIIKAANRKVEVSILISEQANIGNDNNYRRAEKIMNESSAKIYLSKKDKILCAKYRKGHFEGVIDVMTRLTEKVKPSKIFMGEKDFQQLMLVKRFIENNFKSKIVSCKTIRDKNKLALSSRNLLLNKKELLRAGKLAQNVINFKNKLTNKKITKNLLDMKKKELVKKYDIKIEYFELRDLLNLKVSNTIKNSNFFISYFIKKVRLIDNF